MISFKQDLDWSALPKCESIHQDGSSMISPWNELKVGSQCQRDFASRVIASETFANEVFFTIFSRRANCHVPLASFCRILALSLASGTGDLSMRASDNAIPFSELGVKRT